MGSRIIDVSSAAIVLAVLASNAARLQGDTYLSARRLCTLSDSRIVEASGITPSLRRPTICWTHNDSGDSPRIFAFRIEDGVVIAEVAVSGASAVDWESIESGPGPVAGRPYLYIGDTGNNGLNRTNLRVYRIPEPELATLDAGQKFTSVPAEKLRFTYADGNFDCEGLAVHPWTGEVCLFAKKGAPSGVYRLTALVDDGQSHVAERVGTMNVSNVITSAAFSPDGLRLAVRTYAGIHEMKATSIDAAIADFVNQVPVAISPPSESQGEALCYAADGSGIQTVSEGRNVPVYFLERKVSTLQPFCDPTSEIESPDSEPVEATPNGTIFLRADSNDDGVLDISDAMYLLVASFVTSEPLPCEDASDANDDGVLDISDSVAILKWLLFGSRVQSITGVPGEDLTPDALGCTTHEPPAPPPEDPGSATILVAIGEPWRYRGVAEKPPASWKDPGFDSSGWPEGASGLGYGDGDDATIVTIQNVCMTLYAVKEFEVADPTRFTNPILRVDYDDGFVAYLNGVEVARRGLGAAGFVPGFDQAADLREAGTPESIPLCRGPLVPGRNVLAIEVHNATLASADLSLEPELLGK